MKSILYLSIFHDENYLVFPSALPENYYAPGNFVIESRYDNLDESYLFLAVDNEIEVPLTLTRIRDRFYKAISPDNSEYFFSVHSIDEFWWHFSSPFGERLRLKHNPSAEFCILQPTDHNKLEAAALMKKFYFVGLIE
jgi:hypothetical protein